MDYLLEKVSVTGKNPIKISHKEIANDLGTAREVISRLVKKLERQNILKQYHDSIELINLSDFSHCTGILIYRPLFSNAEDENNFQIYADVPIVHCNHFFHCINRKIF
ncbi:MAG: winged helix-turn-helix domain-containing protein [Bacteroidetes bacterium]|nr:winged helix-turn-helix domain-containing protein [Bacteroidota bacterium]